MPLAIASAAFRDAQAIPPRYTCEGDDISPPLEWTGVPDAARSLALIVDDPDAPDPAAPRRTWVHWVLCNIPADQPGLAEAARGEDLPPGTIQGVNDWKKLGYGGPCPPIGRHRYFFKIYALDRVLEDLVRPTKAELQRAMRGHVLAEAQLVGVYERQTR